MESVGRFYTAAQTRKCRPLLMFIYSLAWMLLLAASAPLWLWKMATTGKYREGLGERLGWVPARLGLPEKRPVIWIHAVSVGEVIAVSGLVRELQSRLPGHRVILSTTTRTGQQIARERFGAENVFYYPLDFAFAVRAYLRALNPKIFVLAETEFWPRMLHECRGARVPVVVVNARISDRSYPRYLRLSRLWRRILRGLSVVLAQTEVDVARLRAIGAPPDRVRQGGNLKFDVRANPASEAVALIRSALPRPAQLLVAGSTLEGEEQLLLDAWPALANAAPELRMVLASRHPERFARVATLLERSGIPWQRRSEWLPSAQPGLAPGSILLLDSIGELAALYSLATVAFVGGSLVPAGGHNPLEPAQFGVPIVMGSHVNNFREIVDKLQARDAIHIVDASENPTALEKTLLGLLHDQETARAMGARARAVFEAEAGATVRAANAIVALLPEEAA